MQPTVSSMVRSRTRRAPRWAYGCAAVTASSVAVPHPPPPPTPPAPVPWQPSPPPYPGVLLLMAAPWQPFPPAGTSSFAFVSHCRRFGEQSLVPRALVTEQARSMVFQKDENLKSSIAINSESVNAAVVQSERTRMESPLCRWRCLFANKCQVTKVTKVSCPVLDDQLAPPGSGRFDALRGGGQLHRRPEVRRL